MTGLQETTESDRIVLAEQNKENKKSDPSAENQSNTNEQKPE
jgi:hypothetical protein